MNLGEIRNRIAFILDYDPSRTEYINDLNDLINRTYRDFFTEQDWLFAQKEKGISARKTLTTTELRVTNGSAVLTTTSPFFIANNMEGMIIDIEEVEYTIAWVVSTTSAYLIQPYEGATKVNAKAKVYHRYIDLPSDCVRILDVFRREPNNPETMLPINRSDEGYYAVDFDEEGEPLRWLPVDNFNVKAPRNKAFTAVTSGSGHGTRTLEFVTTYKYFNKESGFSAVTELELADNEKAQWVYPNLPNTSGRIYQVYCRNKDYSEKWFKVADDVSNITDFVPNIGGTYIFTLATSFWNDTLELTNSNPPENNGVYKRFRLWPAQDDDYTIFVRYIYQPALLRDDEDTPEFDEAHHEILVFKAVREMFAKRGDAALAGMYGSKVKNKMTKIGNNALNQTQQRWVKGQGSFPIRRRGSRLVAGDNFGTLP